jgi:hypothetical protein
MSAGALEMDELLDQVLKDERAVALQELPERDETAIDIAEPIVRTAAAQREPSRRS